VRGILEDRGIPCVDGILEGVSTLQLGKAHQRLRSSLDWTELGSGWSFATELFIDGVVER